MDYSKLGAKVRKERLKKSLTQEQLAELCNISPSFIGIIERGDKKLSVETLLKISTVLGVTTDYLLKDIIYSTPETKLNEILVTIKDLQNNDIDLVIDIIKTISTHKTKK